MILKKILIVEDDPGMRITLGLILNRAGFEVKMAANLAEGHTNLKAQRWDMVILDVHLPDGNGLEFLKQIRGMCPDLPVVIFTAYDSIEVAEIARQNGATDYLCKPIEPKLIIERASNILLEDHPQILVRRREDAVSQR